MSDPDDLLARALAEFVDLQAQGEAVDVHDFCRKYPEIGSELREHLDTLREIDTMIEPAGTAALKTVEPLPEKLSGHTILGEIGSGGMGRVLLARDERLGRQVAIKTLNSRYRNNQRVKARFLEEARAMARLSHPHVVRIYNLGPADEDAHFVMEYVEGVPLTEGSRALSLLQKVELIHKVALAAAFLHQHQVIHRDLKPGNILVGHDLEPKLLDFGLA